MGGAGFVTRGGKVMGRRRGQVLKRGSEVMGWRRGGRGFDCYRGRSHGAQGEEGGWGGG